MVHMNWFVTGASSGIGRGIALELAKRGDAVALFARSADKLEAVAAEVRLLGGKAPVFPGDVRRYMDIENAVRESYEAMGSLDAVVSCAGMGHLGSFVEQDPERWGEMFSTNALGAMHLVKAALPGMLERKEGRIGIISSIIGRMGFAGMTSYSASKFALHGFVQGLRAELRNTSISLTLICPGTVETPFLEKIDRKYIPSQDRYLPHLTPEQVARMTVKAVLKRTKMITRPTVAWLLLRLHDFFPKTIERVFYWF